MHNIRIYYFRYNRYITEIIFYIESAVSNIITPKKKHALIIILLCMSIIYVTRNNDA